MVSTPVRATLSLLSPSPAADLYPHPTPFTRTTAEALQMTATTPTRCTDEGRRVRAP